MENPGVEEREDLGQDFGWESIHRPDRVDGKPQFAIDTGELGGPGSMDRTKIVGGNFLTVDSYLVPHAERCPTLSLSRVTS